MRGSLERIVFRPRSSHTQSHQNNRAKNANDRNNNQKFNYGETSPAVGFGFFI